MHGEWLHVCGRNRADQGDVVWTLSSGGWSGDGCPPVSTIFGVQRAQEKISRLGGAIFNLLEPGRGKCSVNAWMLGCFVFQGPLSQILIQILQTLDGEIRSYMGPRIVRDWCSRARSTRVWSSSFHSLCGSFEICCWGLEEPDRRMDGPVLAECFSLLLDESAFWRAGKKK